MILKELRLMVNNELDKYDEESELLYFKFHDKYMGLKFSFEIKQQEGDE